jgi:hypothetical protein
MKLDTKKIAIGIGIGALLGLIIKKTMSKYPLIWSTILKGESKTFNDYNYYKIVNGNNKLYGKISASSTEPFTSKKLSLCTIKEVMEFQSRSRIDGQLWATGRFQIIPATLSGLVKKLNLASTTIYNEATQMKMGDALIDERKNVYNYLNGKVADSVENLQLATLDVAKVWSSVGVPFETRGSRQLVKKDQSYYEGGGDRAHVDSNSVMDVLKRQRKALGY